MKTLTKYGKLKSYLETKYSYLASLGQYQLGDLETIESEAQWSMIRDIMEYIDVLEEESEKVVNLHGNHNNRKQDSESKSKESRTH